MATQRKGFTLVELSIVLIIIGLIIGGVLKGTDLINSAKQKKLYNTFVKGWQVATSQYQDRTGQILGDGTVNGGTQATTDGLRDGNIALTAAGAAVTRLNAIGIDIPTSNTGLPNTYSMEGKYTTRLSVATLNRQILNGSNRNVFQMTLVPLDIAVALDTMIDGTADSRNGDCRLSTVTTDGAVTAWATAVGGNAVTVSIYF